MSRRVDTLVVGAGVSGLAYAHARGRDADLVVLEASERCGGLVRTVRGGDSEQFRCELGPEALRFEVQGGLTEMLAELGITARKPPDSAAKRFLVCKGRLVEAPLGPKLVTTPLMTWRGKLRLLAEPFRDPKLANDGSVADFVRHRIGREGLDALLDPLVSGIHAGDPELLSMRACFPRLVELVQKHGGLFRALFATRGDPAPSVMKPDGGCQAVTDALATALGSKVITRAPVTALSFNGSLWHVISGAGNFDAERVVLALPCTTSARLLTTVAAPLARAIGSVTSENVVSYTHAWRRENVGTRAPGFGYLVPSREKLQHLGTLFSSGIAPSSCPDGFVVFRTLLGGARHPELVDRDDAELAALVRREVAPLLDLRGEPVFTLVQRWRATLPRLDLQHPQRLAAIEQALPPGLTLLGNWLRGIGVNHLVADAREHARKHALPTRA